MKYAVLFPGQGSQTVGMCREVRDVRADLFGDAANAILGWNLNDLIDNGPQERLTETQFAQPALYATAYGLWSAVAERLTNPPAAAAGHSLGEYTALAAAGAMSYEDGLRLVKARGEAMARCAEGSPSGMAALLGADADTAERIAADRRADGGELFVANLNAPGQIVVAGGIDDLEWLSENARELGVRRAVVLDVAAGFHSPFMAPATDELRTALTDVTFDPPAFPVYANATAATTTDPAHTLLEQLTAPVRFSDSLAAMAEAGVTDFVHVGPGDVTAGLAKRTVRDANIHTVSNLDEVAAVAEALSVQ